MEFSRCTRGIPPDRDAGQRAGLSKLNSVSDVEVDVRSRRARASDDVSRDGIDEPGDLPE
jgi:hypothetical protein